MQRLITKTLLTGTVLIASALLVTSEAGAGQPIKIEFPAFTVTYVVTDLADFPITVEATVIITAIDYFDLSGALIRTRNHIVEQDTFTANGKTLVGEPYTMNIQVEWDADGNVTGVDMTGGVEKVRLPDGGLFVAAGRIDVLAHEEDLLLKPDKGACVNLEGFVEALSPDP